MNKIPNFDEFINEGINDLVGVMSSIAKKVATTLNKQKEYTLPEIAKAIALSGGVAAMHSRDVKKVMDELEKEGFKMKVEKLEESVLSDRLEKLKSMKDFNSSDLRGIYIHTDERGKEEEDSRLLFIMSSRYSDDAANKIHIAAGKSGLKDDDYSISSTNVNDIYYKKIG